MSLLKWWLRKIGNSSNIYIFALYGYFSKEGSSYKQIKPHPLPWLTEILNGVEHANFFEARATEYSKGATEGEWFGKDGVWHTFEKSYSIKDK